MLFIASCKNLRINLVSILHLPTQHQNIEINAFTIPLNPRKLKLIHAEANIRSCTVIDTP